MAAQEQSRVVLSYAKALLELSNPIGAAEAIGQELGDLAGIVASNETFALFLADPAISEAERQGVLERALKDRVHPLLWKFLGVLNIKGRLKSLAQISQAYEDLLEDQFGKIEVDVYTAHKLDADQLGNVREKVSAALKRDAVLHNYVDESIIGGMILQVQDKLIDASVRQQLKSIRDRMLAARPR